VGPDRPSEQADRPADTEPAREDAAPGGPDLSAPLPDVFAPPSDAGNDADAIAQGPVTCSSTADCRGGYNCSGSLCLPPGLVLYWKLDEMGTSIADSSGQGHTAKALGEGGVPAMSSNIPTLQFTNRASRAFMAGQRHAIQLVAMPAALRPANNYTVSVWYRASRVPGSGMEVVSGGDSYMLRVRADVLEFSKRVMSPTGPSWLMCQGSWPGHLDGSWHHLAGVATSSANSASMGMSVFVDGVERCNLPFTQNVFYTTAPDLWVGRHGAGDGGGSATWDFEGNIDEVRIYNRALSAGEVANLAAGQN
jgi:hypothetical protein